MNAAVLKNGTVGQLIPNKVCGNGTQKCRQFCFRKYSFSESIK
jgi:hypothetical protein